MKGTQLLHDRGQSLWLDNISRGLIKGGELRRYIQEFSITGLTSNPTIFKNAILKSSDYDEAIRQKTRAGLEGESLFFELAIEDLRQAADLFRPIYEHTNGLDGWVSLEISPLLANDTPGSIASAKELHERAARPNIFIKIPGTPAGIPAIEESIFAGVPINVTLLFSERQYQSAAEAYVRGIERRIAANLKPDVLSVASLFISRWDVAVMDKTPASLRNQLGIAIANQTYKAYRQVLDTPRMQRLLNLGARSQRLLWASTGAKDSSASELLYVKALAAPFTINTLPEKTLMALANYSETAPLMSPDGGDYEKKLSKFISAGLNPDALAVQLQVEGAEAFSAAWRDLMQSLDSKSVALKKAG